MGAPPPRNYYGGLGLGAMLALAMSGDNQMRVRVGPLKAQKPARPSSNRKAKLLEKARRRRARVGE